MKFVTFVSGEATELGVVLDRNRLVRLTAADALLQSVFSVGDLLQVGDTALSAARALAANPPTERLATVESVRLLAPIPHPRKNVYCVGRNYKDHIIEAARARGVEPTFPKVPEFFTKPPTSIIGPEAGIQRHRAHTSQLDYEVELAIVIGRRGRDISAATAMAHVFGYTIVNDISARDAQFAHGQFFKGKSFDTFCPMGPCVVTTDEFGDAGGHRITLRVNGETRQDSNTLDLLFGVPQIIESLSAGITLEPGDVIATGTPSGVALGMRPQRWLDVGDVVEAAIEGIGILRNHVVER